jgi:predicted CoA-binding protein
MDESVEQFIPVIWTTRLGVVDDAATCRAKEKVAILILDRCPKVSTTFLI